MSTGKLPIRCPVALPFATTTFFSYNSPDATCVKGIQLKEALVPIKYKIVASKLPANREGYIAQVQSRGTVEIEELTEDMAHLGTTASQPDMLNIIRHFTEEMMRRLLRGEIVNTPLGTFFLAMQGTFTGFEDHFDAARHRLVIRFIPERSLYAALLSAQLVKVDSVTPVPCPLTYIDTATKHFNGPVTPGNQGQLRGADLQYDEDDPRQGIFFIAMDGTETRVRWAALNDPSMSVFIIPPLPAGQYHLAVRVAYGEAGVVREGRLGHVLTVE
jgi:hypothetical protein